MDLVCGKERDRVHVGSVQLVFLASEGYFPLNKYGVSALKRQRNGCFGSGSLALCCCYEDDFVFPYSPPNVRKTSPLVINPRYHKEAQSKCIRLQSKHWATTGEVIYATPQLPPRGQALFVWRSCWGREPCFSRLVCPSTRKRLSVNVGWPHGRMNEMFLCW